MSLVAVSLLVSFDVATAPLFPGTTQAQLAVSGDVESAKNLVLVFPGYAADCQALKSAFVDYLELDQAMVVVCYPTRRFDDDHIYRVLKPLLESNESARITVLAGSMGGLVATAFLSRLTHELPAGESRDIRLALDTSPAGPGYLQSSSLLRAAVCWYPGGGLSSIAWAGWQALPRDEPDIDALGVLDAVAQGNAYNQWVGTPTLMAQARYICSYELPGLSPAQSVGEVVYIRAADASEDPFVQVHRSLLAWRKVYPQMEVRVLEERQGDWHIPWTYRPREIMSVVADLAADERLRSSATGASRSRLPAAQWGSPNFW